MAIRSATRLAARSSSGRRPSDGRYPAIYVLHAMTGQARAWFNVSPFKPSSAEEIEGLGLDAVIVLVDGFTSLGGAQWIDSERIGNYGRYLCEDVVDYVDANFPTLPTPPIAASRGSRPGGSARSSGRCSGRTSSAASPLTPATHSSR